MKLNATASALNGVSSWNFTSRRNGMRRVRRSSDSSGRSAASHGMILLPGAHVYRFSYIGKPLR